LQIPAKSKPAHPTLVEETPHTNEYSLHPEDEPQLPKLLYLDEILGNKNKYILIFRNNLGIFMRKI
jgi:hypothetical protein